MGICSRKEISKCVQMSNLLGPCGVKTGKVGGLPREEYCMQQCADGYKCENGEIPLDPGTCVEQK